MPIGVTDKAAREVSALIDGKQKAALRVWVAGVGCGGFRYGMGIDEREPEADDSVFESNGIRVVVDPQSLSFMDGSTVDYVDGEEKGGFSIENPNPPPQDCECGDSACGTGDCGTGDCGCGSAE